MSRSPSWLARNNSGRRGEGLGRKRSMLSRQYQPKHGDKVEEEVPPLPDRRRASIFGGRTGERGLTLDDLQKLETIIDEEGADDPETMRKLLRRSLSLNVAPGFLQDDVAQGQDGDAPLPLPRPASILRRSARTKIRKGSPTGEGGAHRFTAASRKGRVAAPSYEIPEDDEVEGRKSSDPSDESAENQSSETWHDSVETHATTPEDKFADAEPSGYEPKHFENRRSSDASTDEAMIFDAYSGGTESRKSSGSSASGSHSHEDAGEEAPKNYLGIPPALLTPDSGGWYSGMFEGEKTPTQESVDPMSTIRRPSPGVDPERTPGPSAALTLEIPGSSYGVKSPISPTTPQARPSALPFPSNDLLPGMAPPQARISVTPAIPDSPKQGMSPVNIDRPPLQRTESASTNSSVERAKEKEKKGGFFSKKDKDKKKKEKDGFLGGLFGSKKKIEEPPASGVSVSNFSSAGPAAAAALLGSSKSARSVAPSPTSPGFNNYARYPIHVERAIYRLSHIKLANARRPLYEQVLISNLMFWYLGVIGRNVNEEKKASAGAKDSGDPEKSKEERPVIAKGTPPKALDTGSAGKPQPHPTVPEPQPQQSPTKRTGLTKPERGRDRTGEVAVRPPQYGMQNSQVDHEMRSAQAAAQSQANKRPPQVSPPPQQQHSPYDGPRPLPGQPVQGDRPATYHSYPQDRQNGSLPRTSSGTLPQQSPQPSRALSPPALGQSPRPMPDSYPQSAHPSLQGPPRGVPQSSFGPPPPLNGPSGPGIPGVEQRQRTMSNPNPAPGSQPMQGRRVVTDGRPFPSPPPQQAHHHMNGTAPQAPPGQGQPQPHRQRSGPQPGEIFQYPTPPPAASPFQQRPGSGGPQPGQIFTGTQPGQVFHHPQQPQYRPTAPPGPHGPQRLPLQPQSHGMAPPGHAGPAGYARPPMEQKWMPPPNNARPLPEGYRPPQQRPHPHSHAHDPYARPPQGYPPGQPQAHHYPVQQRPPSPAYPGYAPPQGVGPGELYGRRPQPVPPGPPQGYPHHR